MSRNENADGDAAGDPQGDGLQVNPLIRDHIRAQDRNAVLGGGIGPTLWAARNGFTSILAERLQRGADPNQNDGYGGTCLVASASYGHPECTRLLIAHNADVTHEYVGDHGSILYMLAYCFQDMPMDNYREGDFVLNATLLVDSGATIHQVATLDILRSMDTEEGTKHDRERQGLISVLEHQYWQEYGSNPFLRASVEEATWLLLQGAATNSNGAIDRTKVRSIEPNNRQNVRDLLLEYQETRISFMHILIVLKKKGSNSPIEALGGHERTILSIIGSFAGVVGWSEDSLEQAVGVMNEVIAFFNSDREDD